MQPLRGPQHGSRHRHNRSAAVLAASLVMALAAPTAALAQPSGAARKPSGDTSFSSSFEADQKQPDWRSTVEEDADGKKRASGIDGGFADGIPGNVTDQVTDVRASSENSGGGEGKENLVDVEPGSKWLAFQATGWVEFDLAEPTKVVTYALTSANDHDERDPKDWTLKGSADGKTWTDLDTRTGQAFSERHQTKSFDFTTGTAYQHFRLEITKNNGASDAIQLADVQFSNGDTSTPAPDDMRTQPDRGPSGSPTAKQGAGFTGKKALRYAGTHKSEGHAYSYNKVFDVDTAITKDTQLSYLVYPQMGETDLAYPATHVAVDLAFTDGTYLSELKATDSHGGLLTPQGQADAKRLYVNQWNKVASRIGSVAAGKTVDRILVAYDSPKGPSKFQGGSTTSRSPRRPREAQGAPLGLRVDRPRHQLQRRLLARQHLPRDRGAARLQLLDAGHQRGLHELAVRLLPGQQRGQPAHPAGLRREPRAEPLDGGPPDLPDDAVGGLRHPGRLPHGPCAAVPPRERDGDAALLRGDVRERPQGRDGADRPRGTDALHLPR